MIRNAERVLITASACAMGHRSGDARQALRGSSGPVKRKVDSMAPC
jgi:hypothetical protein